MVIRLKMDSYNGASVIETFNTVKDAEKYLNEAAYYTEKVWLSSSFGEFSEYTSKTRLAKMMRDAITYGEGFIRVSVEF